MLIIDDFLSDFDALRDYADSALFADLMNPADGVVYPLICAEIPEDIKTEIIGRLEDFKRAPVDNITMFMRMSPAGVPVPHAAHSDKSMGRYSLMLYLNRADQCRGGTSFLSHKASGIAYNPGHPAFVSIVTADQNNAEAWTVRDMASMRPNRAVIFRADTLHRAEPVGGFGSTNQDARIVLTCFFS